MNGTAAARRADFSKVTELAGQMATGTQMGMLRARYAWAASRGQGRDVLEVACGAGLGLRCLASVARSVEAGDLDPANCERARRSGVGVRRMDAAELPFGEETFDCAVLFEALYYLPDAAGFIREARRVLRPGGRLLMTAPNPEWRGFHPSPWSTAYFTAAELGAMLTTGGFEARIWAAFPEPRGLAAESVALLRRCAARLGWIPKTMSGKAFLKRAFYGRMEAIPASLAPARWCAGLLVDARRARLKQCRVLYAEGIK
jgi:SAM-dependent methyltransferase